MKLFWRDLQILIFSLLHLMLKVTFRRICVLFPGQLPKWSVSWESNCKYLMISHSWWYAGWACVLPVLEYCPAMWCSTADTHLCLLDCVVSAWSQSNSLRVVEFNISHRRSGVVLCMLYKFRSNPMLFVCGALTERIPYILCTHLGACRFLTALMHLQNSNTPLKFI